MKHFALAVCPWMALLVLRVGSARAEEDWAIAIGGPLEDHVHACARHPSGDICLAGATRSSSVRAGSAAAIAIENKGDLDAFVMKLMPSGEAVFAVSLGGTGEDRALAVAVGEDGAAVVAGFTTSMDFPVTNGSTRSGNGSGRYFADAFVAKLGPDGGEILFSTYLGGRSYDNATDVVLEERGSILVFGQTGSADFPVRPGALQDHYGGNWDYFIARLDPLPAGAIDDQLTYSSFLGGSGRETSVAFDPVEDFAHDYGSLLLDSDGRAILVGGTRSTDFPTTDGQPPVQDAFVLRLRADPALSTDEQVDFAAFFGGSSQDMPLHAARDGEGNLWIGGFTWSRDFPTTPDAFQGFPVNTQGYEGFLVRLSVDCDGTVEDCLLYSTYLAGGEYERVMAVAVLPMGGIAFGGQVVETNAFLGYLDAGGELLAFPRIHGAGNSKITGLATAGDGRFIAAGSSDAGTLAGLPEPLFLSHGARDTFVASLEVRRPAADFTIAGPGADGRVRVEVSTSTTPAGTEPLAFLWSFGDGSEAQGPSAEHAYGPGRFEITLRASNAVGGVVNVKKAVIVSCSARDVSPWTSVDIREPAIPGAARIEMDAESECLEICAGGSGFATTRDQFHWVYQEVRGDFTLTARAGEINDGALDAEAGLMVRESLDPRSPHVALTFTVSTELSEHLLERLESGKAPSRETFDGIMVDQPWRRLARRDGVVSAYRSADGVAWELLGAPVTLPSGADKVLVGFAAAAKYTASGESFPAFHARFCEATLETSAPRSRFRRGDADASGDLDLTDAVATLGYLFLGAQGPACLDAADADDSGTLDISDAVYSLGYLFVGGPALPAPFPDCGEDPTSDELGDCPRDPARC